MRTILLSLALVLALALPALAQSCTPGSAAPEFITPTCAVAGAPCVYVDNDRCGGAGECIFSTWIYQESNGIPGLQRQDEVVDNTCDGQIPGDTIIF